MMTRRERDLLLLATGLGLLVIGHRIVDTEVTRLGWPHAAGALLVASAMRTSGGA